MTLARASWWNVGFWCLAWSCVACESTLPATFDGLPCDEGGRCLPGYVCDATLTCVKPKPGSSTGSGGAINSEAPGGKTSRVDNTGSVDGNEASGGDGTADGAGGAGSTAPGSKGGTSGGGTSGRGGSSAQGGTGQAGTSGQTGSSGASGLDCGDKTACDGACVDVKKDAANCGGCARKCTPPPGGAALCDNGACTFTCLDGRKKCGDACVDIKTDPANCGHCGTVCKDAPGASAICSDAQCKLSCDAGLSLCEGECVDVGSDGKNCGRCGHKCPSDASCLLGVCTPG